MILPGVGAARAAMERLRPAGLDRLIPTLTQPVLGICLGMQLLFDASEEDDARCLGIMPGIARRLMPPRTARAAHGLEPGCTAMAEARCCREFPMVRYFYFVHSYALPVSRSHRGHEATTAGTFLGHRRAGQFPRHPVSPGALR